MDAVLPPLRYNVISYYFLDVMFEKAPYFAAFVVVSASFAAAFCRNGFPISRFVSSIGALLISRVPHRHNLRSNTCHNGNHTPAETEIFISSTYLCYLIVLIILRCLFVFQGLHVLHRFNNHCSTWLMRQQHLPLTSLIFVWDTCLPIASDKTGSYCAFWEWCDFSRASNRGC